MLGPLISFLHRTPFLRYLLFYVFGVVAYLSFPFGLAICLVVSVLAFLIFTQKNKTNNITKTNAALHLGIGLLAFAQCYICDDDNYQNFILKKGETTQYQAIVLRQVAENRLEAKIVNAYNGTKWHPCLGSVALTVKEGIVAQRNDTLLIAGKPELVRGPQNPEEFNHKLYFKSKGILLQHYVLKQAVLKHLPYKGFSIINLADDFRSHLAGIIRAYMPNQENSSIVEALVLGLRTKISDELLQAYSHTGTIHVLAVSGMHVGIFYGTILWLLRLLLGTKYAKYSAVVSLVVMWFFAMVTGFSSSVVRAAVMYSVFQLGVIADRKVDIANTLFSSAFIILVLQPFMLLDVGFQLSFFAVLGIVGFQQFFQRVLDIQNNILRFFYDLVTVSVSAQLGVLPITIYYFHQFPNLFIVSNLFEIVLSTMALYLAMIGLLLSPISVISKFIYLGVDVLVTCMNKIALFLSKLPFAISKIYIDNIQLLLMSLLVLSLMATLVARKQVYVKLLLSGLFVLLVYNFGKSVSLKYLQRIVFYANKNEQIIDVSDGKYLFRIRCNEYHEPNKKLYNTLMINNLKNDIASQQEVLLGKNNTASVSVFGKRMQVLNATNNTVDDSTDIALINSYYLNTLPNNQKVKLIVRYQKLYDYLQKNGYNNIHCLQKQGAYVFENYNWPKFF